MITLERYKELYGELSKDVLENLYYQKARPELDASLIKKWARRESKSIGA